MTKQAPFIDPDFLLENDFARELYHDHAATQPILDFHNHLSPRQIAENHQFRDLQEIWLGGDHYKWRALRTNGIPERLITGEASPREKFDVWAATVPYTLRNPLYHWTHLELARHFGFQELLSPETAGTVWDLASTALPRLRVHDLLAQHRVKALCTTDDPADSLEFHEAIRRGPLPTKVYPTFRPDKALQLRDAQAFNAWLDRLAAVSGIAVATLDDLLQALKSRHAAFHTLGCRLSDHGLICCPFPPCDPAQAARIFASARSGQTVTPDEETAYAAFLLLEFGRWNAAAGWTMQLHLGALRNNNTRLLRTLGADAGVDSIGDFPQAATLSGFLNALDQTDELPRVILYNLNPADNYLFASMAGNFQGGTVAGKIQHGPSWWFLDQKEGIEWQLDTLSNLGLLRRFVGMVTDSRSFLSFCRHEYFRRVLCNLLGRDMAKGLIPADSVLIGTMVREICYGNARDYFGLETAE